jgi:hypothetical protein
MTHEKLKRGVIGIGELIDLLVQANVSQAVIVIACHELEVWAFNRDSRAASMN